MEDFDRPYGTLDADKRLKTAGNSMNPLVIDKKLANRSITPFVCTKGRTNLIMSTSATI